MLFGFLLLCYLLFFFNFNCIFTESCVFSLFPAKLFSIVPDIENNLTKRQFILNVTLKTYQELNIISYFFLVLIDMFIIMLSCFPLFYFYWGIHDGYSCISRDNSPRCLLCYTTFYCFIFKKGKKCQVLGWNQNIIVYKLWCYSLSKTLNCADASFTDLNTVHINITKKYIYISLLL